jgi:hypothetical protein
MSEAFVNAKAITGQPNTGAARRRHQPRLVHSGGWH